MDFADILNQWEDSQNKPKNVKKRPQVSHKKANAPTKEEKEAMRQGYSYEQQMLEDNKRRVNPMDVWLNHHGVIDKDKIADEAAAEARLNNREYLQSLRAEAVLDLHGLTRDEAWERMQNFVSDCIKRGLKKIQFIHGKGNHSTGSDPVLGQTVRLFIEQHKNLGTSGHPDSNHGGNGATWVLIKN